MTSFPLSNTEIVNLARYHSENGNLAYANEFATVALERQAITNEEFAKLIQEASKNLATTPEELQEFLKNPIDLQ